MGIERPATKMLPVQRRIGGEENHRCRRAHTRLQRRQHIERTCDCSIIQTEMRSSRTVPTFLLENFPGEVPIGEEKPGEKNKFKRAEGFPEIVGEKGGEREEIR